jgi:hypothetical protein
MYCTVGTPRPRVLAVMLCKLEERCMQCKQHALLLRIGELAKLGNLFPFFLVYCTTTTLTAVAQSVRKRNDLEVEAFASASASALLPPTRSQARPATTYSDDAHDSSCWPLLSSPIFPKFYYAKRRFSVTSKCRQMHGVLNVNEIKN